jgi:branched-subunit amino acid transport protein
MTEVWLVISAVAAATIVFKAAGPVFLGGRALSPRVRGLVSLLAPVMLTALVVTQTLGSDGSLSLDARVPGVAAAALALWRRVPIVGAMAIAAIVTASVRLLA